MYGYPVDAGCSFHCARDNIKSYIFFCTYSSMETIVISSGWSVFSTFNYFVPTGNKDINNNNKNSL